MKTLFVAAIFDRTILIECISLDTTVLHCQRVIYNQLCWNNRVYFGRITTLLGDSIAQTCQIDQRRLTQDVMTNHPRRIPGKIQILSALYYLSQGIAKRLGIAAPN